MDKKKANEIKEAKSLKKKEANEAKLKEKQLEKQRTRIYNEMVSYQKKIKKAPKVECLKTYFGFLSIPLFL